MLCALALASCDYLPMSKREARHIAAEDNSQLISDNQDQSVAIADLKRRVEMLERVNGEYARALDELYSRSGSGPSPYVYKGRR